MNAIHSSILDDFKAVNHFPEKECDEDFTPEEEKEEPVICNLCGEEIDPADYDAIEYTGINYGFDIREVACGTCLEDPDFKDILSRVKNFKKTLINR